MASTYNVGDLVQLKSGGPTMVVSSVNEERDGSSAHCQWFAGKKREGGFFNTAILIPVEEKKG